jgi:hypothetical protein
MKPIAEPIAGSVKVPSVSFLCLEEVVMRIIRGTLIKVRVKASVPDPFTDVTDIAETITKVLTHHASVLPYKVSIRKLTFRQAIFTAVDRIRQLAKRR